MTKEHPPNTRRTFAKFCQDNLVPIGFGIVTGTIISALYIVKSTFDERNDIFRETETDIAESIKEASKSGYMKVIPNVTFVEPLDN